MRLLIVHLSDLHVQASEDGVLARARLITDAIRSRNEAADLILCVVSGDISFSGNVEQFDLVRTFLSSIAAPFDGAMRFALVPGNHDVDFGQANAARDALLKTVLQSPSEKIDESILEILAGPQRQFFAFRDSMLHGGKVTGDVAAYAYEFSAGSGERVVVRCLNSALLSSLKEMPGSLVLASQVADRLARECFTITAFHHPYNWLNPASKKIVRVLEDTSDIILTGHEHEHERSVKYRPESYTSTTYIEAAALQRHDGSGDSAFNVLLADTESASYRFYHFEWDGNIYTSASIVAEWEPLPLQSARSSGFGEVTADFSVWLNDTEIPGEAKRGKRTLSDIFLYPNLSESFRDPSLRRKRSTVRGENVFRTIESKTVAFISGLPKSGRTSLGRKLFLDFHSTGFVPLYVDGAIAGVRAADTLLPLVERVVKAQYGTQLADAYVQLPKERRVVIIDNAERIRGRRLDRIRLVEDLATFAGHVIVLGDDSAGGITEMDAEELCDIGDERASYEIEEFDFAQREEFAQKWFHGDNADEAEASRHLERAEQILDTVIGRSYVPAYPIYVIALLQAVEEGGAIDPKASTHGYFYDLLIRQALTARSEAKDVGIRIAFLTHLASEMHAAGSREVLEPQLRESFRRYDEKYAVGGLEYEKLIAELVDRGMLSREGDTTRFRYPYLYNYFVANYLARSIAEVEVRAEVKRLAANLADDQATDILVFLAHLSHDAFVIDSLLATANGYLTSYEPETLETVKGDDDGEMQLEFVEPESQGEARKELAKRKDAQAADSALSVNGGDPESSKRAVEVLTALHAVRVMGQLVKNFPGVLTKETKVAVVDASCNLALRLLRVALEKVESGRVELLEKIAQVIRRLSPDMPEHRLKVRAERYIWVISIATTYGILRGLTSSIASRELTPIYDLVFLGRVSAAHRLINLALRLDLSGSFPEGLVIKTADDLKGLRLPSLLVCLFVLNHFERIHVAPPKRQSICAKLGIRYQVLPSKKVLALKRT